MTPALAAAGALAAASWWPSQTAARVPHDVSGAQVSAEEVRRLTGVAGTAHAEQQAQDAERLVSPRA